MIQQRTLWGMTRFSGLRERLLLEAFQRGAHDLSATYDGAAVRTYVDGVLDINQSVTGARVSHGQTTARTLGSRNDGGLPFTGVLDELRWSSIARDANWIAAEYNNQNAPGTFYAVGVEQ